MFEQKHDISHITAVILAGGLGTRLRSVVPDGPKVLAEVAGRPFLTYLLDQIDQIGIKEVVLCVGFKSEEILKVIGNKYKSLTIKYSTENKPLGTGGALRLALPRIETRLALVMNGDSYVNVKLTEYIDWFLSANHNAALLLTTVKSVNRYGKVVFDGERIVSFEEKGSDNMPGWINAGVYLLTRTIIEIIPPHIFYSLEQELFPELAHDKLGCYCVAGEFIDIGIPETYNKVSEFFSDCDVL